MNPTQSRPPADLGAIAAAFPLLGRFSDGAPYGSGHINDTFAITMDQAGRPVRYILQRINDRIFKDVPALMDNIQRVTQHAAFAVAADGSADARGALQLVPAREGAPWHRDASGGWWRCYLFVENARTYDVVESPRHAFEAARAFGNFQRLLVDLPGARLHETIAGFHDTRARLENLKRAAAADRAGRAREVQAEIDFALAHEPIAGVLLDLQARGEVPERVTHNDTKFNNVLLDEETGEAMCVVDLDTVMPGLVLYDFGDMVRTTTSRTAEDEQFLDRVELELPMFESLVKGYLEAAGKFLTPAEKRLLVFSGKLITFTIGIRFLTDYLEGDQYFRIHREHHNLDRCRKQFRLIQSITEKQDEMEALVERYSR